MDEYSKRLEQRQAVADREKKLFHWIGNLRLAMGLIAVALAFFVFGAVRLAAWWLIPPLAAFVGLVVYHIRVVERFDRASRAAAFYERGLARLQDRWMGLGEKGERFRDPSHLYAEDLDLFGKGSLFELLCTARTRSGEETLAQWLLAPASTEEVLGRQQAVAELRPDLDLREDLAVLGEDIRSSLHPESLATWGERPMVRFPPGTRVAAAVLSASLLAALSLYLANLIGKAPFLIVLLLQLTYAFLLRPRVVQVLQSIESPARELELLVQVLRRIEGCEFRAPLLNDLRRRLDTAGRPASAQIARLRRLIALLDWRRHQLFAIIAGPLQWGLQFGVAIEHWRNVSGPSIRAWIRTVGEFEALCALAAYAFEHPDDPFPALTAERGWFDAEELGHPLLPVRQAVRNDVRMGGELRLLIVSGSNMSGKSTLLRAVGLNTVLAWAGAPVRARRLGISRLRVGASIRIQDSLLDGRSRFYAEITRLRQIVDLAGGSETLLFLIDELLSGTNSHDRRIGAEAVVRSLVEHGAIGMITTHDLALAHIAETLGPRAVNVHFADRIEEGRLHFDYKLLPGVVEHSNALELMRSVGLEV